MDYMRNTPRAEQDAARKCRTFTGKLVDPFDLNFDDIDIRDIAHQLSNECRFAGTGPFYSVAQHSVQVSWACRREYALAGLLHDAAEAYLKDLPSPIKHAPGMEAYREAEDEATAVIFANFGVDILDLERVKEHDDDMFQNEVEWFWGSRVGQLMCWSPQQAEAEFLAEFHMLRGAEQ